MHRLLLIVFAFLWAGLGQPMAAQSGGDAGLPPRPTPFKFVNDQAQMMAPADAKKLESGLRRYADNTGTQVVVVTVPSLDGRTVADYGRALGEAWGVGQRDKNNGIVVLLSKQERQVTIQPGSGLQNTITPSVTSRVISEMTPGFKRGDYFAGLRTGLNTLMATANPDSAPQGAQTNNASAAGTGAGADANLTAPGAADVDVAKSPGVENDPLLTPPSTDSTPSGFGIGTILMMVVAGGGLLWVVSRLFRRKSAPEAAPASSSASASPAPDFLPNRNPNVGPNNGPGNVQRGGSNFGGGGFGGMGGMGGGGMGGILATGAAAAAGAYLGNRMASGHEAPGQGLAGEGTSNFDPNTAAGAAGAGAVGTGAANDYFSTRDGGSDTPAPDYFSADESADNASPDYFSSDDNASSYDDPSSGDVGGGGFDGTDDNSGSW
ncbi:TPM domain-containing protein [Hymenobacter sp. BT683]|uniref:TPM domain-containing protein n=1 Tax=Hymenobacter jeongseonensis TaxID=2791027 RepID=A0ABS0ICW8_9BACT|nr:TPM domain-containing protein [Hymenobacter jeongseonensis]MBF9236199.1 TPM domain-containing protein [Hymenobacter jeongseonensis]